MSSNPDTPQTDAIAEAGIRMPPALVIVVGITVAAALATLILPAGEFQRIEKNFPNLVRYTIASGDTIETVAAKTGSSIATVSDLRPIHGSVKETPTSMESLTPGTVVLVPVGGMVRRAVVPGTYQAIDRDDERNWVQRVIESAANVSLAPILGFAERAQIIGFVFLLGGAFGVILATGAIDRGLSWAVLRLGTGKAKWAVIPTSFALFSLGGAVFGLGETTIAFVLITVPLAIRLGFDTITGVAMCYMASQVGFAGAFFNPFTVGIAQGIAELPYLSGLYFRYVVWLVVTLIGIAFTIAWAYRVERNPRLSPTFAIDEVHRQSFAEQNLDRIMNPTVRQWLVIVVAFGSVFASGFGVAQWGWYIDEMAALFLVSGVICGGLAGFGPRRISDEFVKGAATMVEPCLIIACSAGIVLVLQQGMVLDTILYAVSTPLERISPGFGGVALMFVQALLNFFVPSGSGQAAMTMPLVTPLCDLIGLNRQVGVLAFQFGDGFGNLIVPTSAVLMGVLGAARVSWMTWIRWVLPLVILLHVVGAIFLLAAAAAPPSWLD